MFTKRSVFLAMLLILALAGMILRPVSAKTVNLQFIETTDIHGSLFPYEVSSQQKRLNILWLRPIRM